MKTILPNEQRGWYQSGTVSKPLAEQIKGEKLKQGYEAVLEPWKMGLFVVKYRKQVKA